VWVNLLAGVWLVLFMFHKVNLNSIFYQARPMIFLLCLWLLWILFQITPLPFALVAKLSPQAAAHYALLPAPPAWITISVEPHATQSAFLKSLAYVLVFCLTLLLINTRKRAKLLAYTLILSGLFQAVYGSLMTLSGLEYGFFIKKTTSLGYVSGTFTNRNHLAGYLVMCLSTGIGLMIANLDNSVITGWKERLHYLVKLSLSAKFRLRLSLVIMVIALVMTHSRMGNASFFASLLIAGGLALLLSRHATRATVILIISLVVIDIFIVGTWFGVEKVVERIEQTSLETEHRDETYGHVRDQWSDYTLTGSGLGTFYAVFPRYKTVLEAGGFYKHAHNDYLEFGSETGIIGLCMMGAVVLLSLVTALIAQYRRHDPLMRGISFAAIMGITAILIHSTVDFNLQIPANALTFMLLLALAWLSLHLKHNH
ncbi:MAG: O-antigen ligase family protein, partial [Gammaproteobacteria bacterium]